MGQGATIVIELPIDPDSADAPDEAVAATSPDTADA